MRKEHKKKACIVIGLIIIILIILFIISKQFRSYLTNPSLLKEFIISFGVMAPIIFILIQTLQAIFPFIPWQLLPIISGSLFGVINGSLFSIIGLGIGISIVFAIAKKFGRKEIENWVGRKEIKKFDNFFNKHGGVYAIFIGRLLPLFPNDVLSFGAGLTPIKFRHYFIASMLAFVPGVIILCAIGSQLTIISLKTLVIVIIAIVLFIVYFNYRHQIKDFLHGCLLGIEKKLESV